MPGIFHTSIPPSASILVSSVGLCRMSSHLPRRVLDTLISWTVVVFGRDRVMMRQAARRRAAECALREGAGRAQAVDVGPAGELQKRSLEILRVCEAAQDRDRVDPTRRVATRVVRKPLENEPERHADVGQAYLHAAPRASER
jgi:hypothetical protein